MKFQTAERAGIGGGSKDLKQPAPSARGARTGVQPHHLKISALRAVRLAHEFPGNGSRVKAPAAAHASPGAQPEETGSGIAEAAAMNEHRVVLQA